MIDDNEQIASDVSSEPSSEVPSEQSSQGNEQEAQTAPKEQSVPYDRFQELVQQKNEFAKRLEAQEREFREFRDQQKKAFEASKPVEKSKEQALIERLKGVDPEFGEWAEQQQKAAAKAQALEQYYLQETQNRRVMEAQNTVQRLHSEYKVTPEAQAIYSNLLVNQVQALEKQGRTVNPSDLPGLYKSVHDTVSKFLDTQKNAAVKSYVVDKKKDSIPAPQKGPAPKAAAKKDSFSRDPEERTAQIVQKAFARLNNRG